MTQTEPTIEIKFIFAPLTFDIRMTIFPPMHFNPTPRPPALTLNNNAETERGNSIHSYSTDIGVS